MGLTVKIIQPSGILDGTQASEFRKEIKASVAQDAQIILIDFHKVTFMDSSGLGALVLALKTVRAAEAKMYLCSINEQIQMLFELTSMDRVFEVFTDREEFNQYLLKNKLS